MGNCSQTPLPDFVQVSSFFSWPEHPGVKLAFSRWVVSIWRLLPAYSPATQPGIQADHGNLWGVWGLRLLPECDNTYTLTEGEEAGKEAACQPPLAWPGFPGQLFPKQAGEEWRGGVP